MNVSSIGEKISEFMSYMISYCFYYVCVSYFILVLLTFNSPKPIVFLYATDNYSSKQVSFSLRFANWYFAH